MYLNFFLTQCYLADNVGSLSFVWLGISQICGFEDGMVLRTRDGEKGARTTGWSRGLTLSFFSWP